MGSMSTWHWYLIIFIGVSLYLFIAFVTRSRRRRKLFTYAERRAYGEQSPLEEPTPDGGQRAPVEEPTPGYIALPYLLAFWVFTILLGLILAPAVDLSELLNSKSDMSRFLFLVISIGFIACLIAGILEHFRPNHSRQLKYSLIMACLPLSTLFLAPTSILHA